MSAPRALAGKASYGWLMNYLFLLVLGCGNPASLPQPNEPPEWPIRDIGVATPAQNEAPAEEAPSGADTPPEAPAEEGAADADATPAAPEKAEPPAGDAPPPVPAEPKVEEPAAD
jgi:hypothetical protein